MRLPKKKTLAAALALSVVAVFLTALPALAAADTVSGFTPICGVVGTSVTITGSGFTAGAPATAVTFPGAVDQTTLSGVSDTQLTAAVPGGSTGTATLTVVDADGNGVSAGSFQVVTPALAPTITSFAPPAGATGASVVIVGSGFCGVTSVQFNATTATFTVNSNNQITALVPAGATVGAIHVTSGAGTVASATNFTPAAATTITSFAPTSGPVGTSVVITGTGFVTVTSVKFNGVAVVSPVTNSATQITAIVPALATTGPITVVDAGGTATSATNFTVTPTVVTHDRAVTLKLKKQLLKQLRASGRVTATDGFAACESDVTVKIQRFFSGAWHTVGVDQTSANGTYTKTLHDKDGKYRAIAAKEVLNSGADVCKVDISPPVNHHH